MTEKGPLKVIAGAFYLAKEKKKQPQGEDAHFVCPEKQTIGVFDGVGGWAKKGINAGLYAEELMSNSLIAVLGEPEGAVDPKRVLEKAYSNTNAKGSSTACIITLKDNRLHYVNVGDSGFIVARSKQVAYKSRVQQHNFNTPYQLGRECDHPRVGFEDKVMVESGDIIVAGTDGLFDNLYHSDILNILEELGGKSPKDLGRVIAELALINSLDKKYFSPYASAALLYGHSHRGGKYDDITVIVGKIESQSYYIPEEILCTANCWSWRILH